MTQRTLDFIIGQRPFIEEFAPQLMRFFIIEPLHTLTNRSHYTKKGTFQLWADREFAKSPVICQTESETTRVLKLYGIRGSYQSMVDYNYHIEGILFKWLTVKKQAVE